MEWLKPLWRPVKYVALALVVVIVLGNLYSWVYGPPFPTAWYTATKADTAEAYERYLAKYPDDHRVPDARKRILHLKYAFGPKYFIIYEGKDFSGEIGLFDFSITTSRESARTLVYAKALEEELKSGGTRMIVVARLVDAKDPRRERTVTASASPPTSRTVSAVTGRVKGIRGGGWNIDGKYQGTDGYGNGLLLQGILEYAPTIDTPPKAGPK